MSSDNSGFGPPQPSQFVLAINKFGGPNVLNIGFRLNLLLQCVSQQVIFVA